MVEADFNIDIKNIVDLSATKINELIRAITVDLHNDIVAGTPVDTGNARGSWDFEFKQDGPTLMGNINNYVDYIIFLEHGTSQQAPNGFIGIALLNKENELQGRQNG